MLSTTQSFPWVGEVGILVLSFVGIRLTYRIWRSPSPSSFRAAGTTGSLSVKVLSASLPATTFFLSMSIMLPMGHLFSSKLTWLALMSRIIFGLFLVLCSVSLISFVLIYTRGVPKYLVPPGWRSPSR